MRLQGLDVTLSSTGNYAGEAQTPSMVGGFSHCALPTMEQKEDPMQHSRGWDVWKLSAQGVI